ncbi:MAG: hypothetical protein Q9217_001157 [Psora testacea]
MASEEDNFDIDIYGVGGEEYTFVGQRETQAEAETSQMDGDAEGPVSNRPSHETTVSTNGVTDQPDVKKEIHTLSSGVAQKIASTDESTTETIHLPKQAPQTQGIRRKDGEEDDRHVDPGATTALFVSELHWWVTDDDIRGWANQSQCEDELEDVTFSEHKVNGKSKGQAYILFKSMQAATAAKQKIETFGEGQQYAKKFTVGYSNPYTNPFKTLPKDGPMRNNASANNNRPNGGPMQSYSGRGYRGGRGGGYNDRGGGVNNAPNYSRGGFQQPISGFQGSGMGGYSPMAGMQPYGGFQARGGMMGGMRGGGMGMRGGRGGTNGFPSNQTHYNPAMFNQQQQGSPGHGGGDTPHGTKRIRHD